MKTKTIRQTIVFHATPHEVYRALMTSRGHAAFTGAPARISPKVGGTFSAWGDYIHGRNLELARDRKIVQSWVPLEEGWPEGHESIVTFELVSVPQGTRLKFTHAQVPPDQVSQLAQGWKDSYWSPLKRYLE